MPCNMTILVMYITFVQDSFSVRMSSIYLKNIYYVFMHEMVPVEGLRIIRCICLIKMQLRQIYIGENKALISVE